MQRKNAADAEPTRPQLAAIRERAEQWIEDWMMDPRFDKPNPRAACERDLLTEAVEGLILEILTEGIP